MDLSELDFKNNYFRKKRNKKKIIIVSLLLPVVIFFGFLLLKVSNVLTIAGGSSGVGVYKDFKVAKDKNRLDILVLGIRGAGDANGGLLADAMILISFDKKKEKAAMISIPRDLYVPMPDYPNSEKINFAYALGEKRQWGGGGLVLSKEVIKYVTGVYVDYAIVVNFDGFEKLVNILGGVEVYRNTVFTEDKQWQGEGREGSSYWYKKTVVNSENEIGESNKIDENSQLLISNLSEADQLPGNLGLPGNPVADKQGIEDVLSEEVKGNQLEVNEASEYWVFYVPGGYSVLNGEEALYYVRSRFSSSDFDRIARQQEVINSMKAKAFSLGVIANPLKVFEILNTLGNNVRTDMGLGDIRELVSLSQKYSKVSIKAALLENSEEGLLKEGFYNGQYILMPKDGDFSNVRDFFKNIFNEDEV